METFLVPVYLRVTAEDKTSAVAAAYVAMEEAFEGYAVYDPIEAEDLPYIHAHDWRIDADAVTTI